MILGSMNVKYNQWKSVYVYLEATMSSKARIEDEINQRIANTEKLFNATEKRNYQEQQKQKCTKDSEIDSDFGMRHLNYDRETPK